MTAGETATRAAWIGVPEAELQALRLAFRRELCAGLRAAFPGARVQLLSGGVRVEVRLVGRRTIHLHEPDHFWGFEPEAERIARAVAAVKTELER